MPRRFRCPTCGNQILTFMLIGEMASCKQCRGEITVPQDAAETSAEPDDRPLHGSHCPELPARSEDWSACLLEDDKCRRQHSVSTPSERSL